MRAYSLPLYVALLAGLLAIPLAALASQLQRLVCMRDA